MNKINKIFFILFLFFISITNVQAYTLIAQPQEANVYLYQVSDEYNSLTNQVIINIPTEVFDQVQTISSYRVKIEENPTASDNLIFRTYIKNPILGYILLNTVTVTPGSVITACGNDPCEIQVIFSSPIDTGVMSGADFYSIGIYTVDTNSAWFYYGYKSPMLFFDQAAITSHLFNTFTVYTESITYANGSTVPNNFVGYNIEHLNLQVYGEWKFPPTPIPPPTPTTTNNPLPCPDCINSTISLPDSGNDTGINFNPDFTNATTTCTGECANTTLLSGQQEGTIPVSGTGSGFGIIMQGLGYCTTDGCTIDDLIAIGYDYSIIGFWISVIILLWKVNILRKRSKKL